MSISQFARTISLLDNIVEISRDLFRSRSTLGGSSNLNAFYSAMEALNGRRPSTIPEASNYLRDMAISFIAYMSSSIVQRKMGSVDFLRDGADVEPQYGVMDSDFVSVYLSSARNMLSESQEAALMRIIRRYPLIQGGLDPAEIMPRTLLRHPDATQLFTGNVHVAPRAVFSFPGGWRASMALIENPSMLQTTGNVYISDTSMYLIFRTIGPIGTGRLGNIALPRGSTGTIFTGTVEIVSHVDEHEVNISPAAAGVAGQCLNSEFANRLYLQIGNQSCVSLR